MIKICLDENDLYELFRGRVLSRPGLSRAKDAEIMLHDIGWDVMQLALVRARRDAGNSGKDRECGGQ